MQVHPGQVLLTACAVDVDETLAAGGAAIGLCD